MPSGDSRRYGQAGTPVGVWALVAVLAVGFVGGGGGLAWFLLSKKPGTATDPTAKPREVAAAGSRDADEVEAIDLFKTVKGSVVNVDTMVVRRGFNNNGEAVQAGTGSGFIWDEEGRIVTNYHVVKTAVLNRLDLRVVLSDRSEWKASIVGLAPDFDLAVIQIAARGGQSKKIKVGTSGDLQVGQRVYAIGNPFGLSLTLTKGIISALDREIDSPSEKPITGIVQTDAPINPGNSGGPLLDKDGRLIGVNTAIATGVKGGGGGSIGIGFAVPVDTVNRVVPSLIRDGRMGHSDLGVRLVDQVRLRQAGYREGVMVAQVEPNGPADQGGLKGLGKNPRTGEVVQGDIILKVNGEAVAGNAEFEKIVAKFPPGKPLTLTVERDEKQVQLTVTPRGA